MILLHQLALSAAVGAMYRPHRNSPSGCLISSPQRGAPLVVFVRNVYSTDRNFYLSDSWLEQAARKQSGGYTRFPVCAEGAPRRILSTKSPARR
jgi:hypothetical protein